MGEVAVVGAGPNGLAAAAVIARAGVPVTVYEANTELGGAARTQRLGTSGASFDLGSAVHPMALLSPAFADLGVHRRVRFETPDLSFAHVLDRRSAHAWRDLDRTAEELEGAEGRAYRRLLAPLSEHIDELATVLLNPLPRAGREAAALARFASAVPGAMVLRDLYSERFPRAAALLAGCAAHLAGGGRGPAALGSGLFLLASAHAGGWPIPIGGSQAISDALAEEAAAHGAQFQRSQPVTDLRQLDEEVVLFAVGAEDAARIAGARIRPPLRRRLANTRRPPGSCVVHYLLREPVPWREKQLHRAGTVHLGGDARRVLRVERQSRTRTVQRPYVIVSQPSLFDSSRTGDDTQVLWAYCHVPRGSSTDMAAAVTAQIEAAAPGFGDTVLERHVTSAAGLEQQNTALVGGDITGGSMDLRGALLRPRLSSSPWRIGHGLYLVSSSASPGPSVHGMGGYLGAADMLRTEYALSV